jgi:hypothetical protein
MAAEVMIRDVQADEPELTRGRPVNGKGFRHTKPSAVALLQSALSTFARISDGVRFYGVVGAQTTPSFTDPSDFRA